MIARAEGITYLFFFPLTKIKWWAIEKNAPRNLAKISPKRCHFGQNIDFIAKVCQYGKNEKNRGWVKTRAIVSRPLI